MCGIAGYFSERAADRLRVKLDRMGEALRHRGPDDVGSVHFPGAGLINRRLAIIDIAGGHQPFLSDDGRIAIVQNGEIFNYRELAAELRRTGTAVRTGSDTEVILRLYEAHGPDFVSRLNGMFAIAIYDAREGKLFLIRDRVGVKPLYIQQAGATLFFASEIKALLAGEAAPAPSALAVDHYLALNFVPPPLTAFEDIEHLPPGSILTADADGVRIDTWWDLARIQVSGEPEATCAGQLADLLADSVRLRMRSDVPFGAFLSGGIDSSTVVGLMAATAGTPVSTFSIGFEDPRYDESPFARQAAERFATRHSLEIVHGDLLDDWPRAVYFCDQPHGDVSFIPTLRLAESAARQVKVVLTGDGGDELFAGYDKYPEFFGGREAPVSSAADWRQDYLDHIGLFTTGERNRLYTPEFRARVARSDPNGMVRAHLGRVEHQDPVNQALYLDTVMLLPGNNLVKPDRMGMAVSLEARTPFLDYRIVEAAFRMPGNYKLRGRETKFILKRAVGALIGEELTNRKKQMFTVPIGDWFRKADPPPALQMLSSERFRRRGIAEPQVVAQMVRDHRDGRLNLTRQLRALVALELWFRIFIDQACARPPTWQSLID